jgi:hypothetical protein
MENLAAWLITVVAGVCLNTLRALNDAAKPFDVRVPDPIISTADDGVTPNAQRYWPARVLAASLVCAFCWTLTSRCCVTPGRLCGCR